MDRARGRAKAEGRATATEPTTGRPSRTLRLRLTLLTAGVLALALTLGALALLRLLEQGRVADLDQAVTARVTTVAELVTTDRVPAALGVAQPGEVVQVIADGRVVVSSANASLTLPVVSPEVLAELTSMLDGGAGDDADGGTGAEPVVLTAPSAYSGPARVAAVRVPSVAAAGGEEADAVLVVAAVPVADVTETVRALGVALAVAVPLLVLGLGLAVWLVLGRALRPVEQLRLAADAVAVAGGPGSLPVPASGELAALAVTLNAMLDRLDAAVGAERTAAGTARAAAERQRSFVADAAHELRSPLASLGTALEVAAAHPEAYPREELVADLSADVVRMQALVEDLLLLARVGSRDLVARPVDLLGTARAAVADAATQAEARGVVVELVGGGEVRDDDLGPGDALAAGDPAAVQRVLRNLVANAVRHARGQVTVRASPGRVEVDDDGAGIPAAERERVFERFVRLDEARERDAGGSGLGLAIARELARELGGDVTLADAPGGGLRAVVTLPVVLP